MKLFIVSLITGVRVPLAAASCWQLLNQHWQAAWVCFFLCVATDVIDGRLARRWKVTTRFGAAADLASDIAIFWVYVPAAYWYSQRYSAWWQEHLPLARLAGFITGVAIALLLVGWTTAGRQLLDWYRRKGNFWCGVIPVAAIGCWISWHAGWWALSLTVAYGLSACWCNRQKLLDHL